MNQKQKKQCEALADLFQAGIDAWSKAGEIITELLNGGATLKEISKYSGISRHDLLQFKAIGEGTLYAGLAVSNTPGARKLRQCPLSEQIKYTHEPIPVLEPITSKHRIVKNIPVNEMTIVQSARVFNCNEIRSVADQDKFIDEREKEKEENAEALVKETQDYRIYSDRLEVKRKCTITKEQLNEIHNIIYGKRCK